MILFRPDGGFSKTGCAEAARKGDCNDAAHPEGARPLIRR
jgi:hypothetical protein